MQKKSLQLLKTIWAPINDAVIEPVKDSVLNYQKHNTQRLGASVTYYTVFSISPLFIFLVGVVALIYGAEQARLEILEQAEMILGYDATNAIKTLLDNAAQPLSGGIAALIGILTLIYGASKMFMELRYAFNKIWDVEEQKSTSFWGFIKDQLTNFAIVFVVGAFMFVSMIAQTIITFVLDSVTNILPFMQKIMSLFPIVSFVIMTGLVALLFKILPNKKIKWSEVLLGAFITTCLLTLGRSLIGMYLARSSTSNLYGAAGSFIVILMWIFYSVQIFLFGAEFTHVWWERKQKKLNQSVPVSESSGS